MANELRKQHALTCDEAVAIVRGELRSRGLAETHRVAALRSAPDQTTEGAAFAAIVLPRESLGCSASCAYKLLISDNGGVICQLCYSRSGARPPVGRGR
jgi:hypothetical protein